LSQIQNKKLYITGHSLGGAMATICASRMVARGIVVSGLYTFGSPRVGDAEFVAHLGTTHFRFVNNNDIVTKAPPLMCGFRHHGQEC